jgi:tetratricopeptide (TPR) repeat protein
MTDEEVLQRLRNAVAEDDVLADPRWEALARGELGAEDERALRQRAADAGLGDEPFAALRPHDQETEDKLIEIALRKVAERAGSGVAGHADLLRTPSAVANENGLGNGPEPIRKARPWSGRKVFAFVGAALVPAAAAAAVFLSRVPGELRVAEVGGLSEYAESRMPAELRLPDYTGMEFHGSQSAQRSPQGTVAVPLFARGGEVEIRIRPATDVKGDVDAAVFLLRDGKAQRLTAPITKAEGGALRIAGTFEEVFGSVPAGKWELVIAVGRPGLLPNEKAVAAGRLETSKRVRIVRQWIEIDGARLGMPSDPPFDVEVSGCETLRAGPVCELAEAGTLRIWARGEAGAPLALALDGTAISDPFQTVRGGQGWEISIPKGTGELSLTTTAGGANVPFTLSLRPARSIPEIAQAKALMDQGKLADAQTLVEALEKHADARVQAGAVRVHAGIHWTQGHIEEAINHYRQAADLDRNAGRLSSALTNELALVQMYLNDGRRFAEARQALERAEQLARAIPVERVRIALSKGMLANETGDWGTALGQFRIVREDSKWSRLDDYLASVLPLEAFLLQMFGRETDGEALLEEAVLAAKTHGEPCLSAYVWSALGWFRVQSHDRRAGAGEALQSALAVYHDSCPRPSEQAQVLTDLSLLALEDGRVEDARSWLFQAKQHKCDARVQVNWLEIEGRIALQQGRYSEALRNYDTLADMAEVGLLPVARWWAQIGRASALEALGRITEAAAAYERAEDMLWEKSLLVPADEGRAGFLGHFDKSARKAIQFFLQRDPGKAATIARRTRVRALATLRWIDRLSTLRPEERAAWDRAMTAYWQERKALEDSAGEYWKLSLAELDKAKAHRRLRTDELLRRLDEAIVALWHDSPLAVRKLPVPSEGELILAYHPLETEWAGFAITREGTTAKIIGKVDPLASGQELSRMLLLPFRQALARARRVRFLVSGPLENIDFHKLPWGRAPLIESLPVTYGIDVGERSGQAKRASGADTIRHALVVGDPQDDLPKAREEARALAEGLEKAGWSTRRLLGAEATYGAVREALNQHAPDLFHYAGHGRFAGREGWESGLPLADHGELSIGDVLALPRAPSVVVLSACEGAKAQGAGAVEGLGLAHAFLSAGADAVVASTRPVNDTLAESIVMSLYGGASNGASGVIAGLRSAEDAAKRLQKTALVEMARKPDGDWASFRVLVP